MTPPWKRRLVRPGTAHLVRAVVTHPQVLSSRNRYNVPDGQIFPRPCGIAQPLASGLAERGGAGGAADDQFRLEQELLRVGGHRFHLVDQQGDG